MLKKIRIIKQLWIAFLVFAIVFFTIPVEGKISMGDYKTSISSSYISSKLDYFNLLRWLRSIPKTPELFVTVKSARTLRLRRK